MALIHSFSPLFYWRNLRFVPDFPIPESILTLL
jgi:hypothetical protein